MTAQGGGSRIEFVVYGLLYAALLPSNALTCELRGLPREALADPEVQHALQVRSQGQVLRCPGWQFFRLQRARVWPRS